MMSSSPFNFLKFPFRSRRDASSSAGAEAGPSTGSSSYESSPPSYSERRGDCWFLPPLSYTCKSTVLEDKKTTKAYDSLSIISTRLPSYRSQTTITALPEWDSMPLMVNRGHLPEYLVLDLLPGPLLDIIASYLPISSQMCLRYASKTTYKSLSVGTSAELLGFERFLENPKEIRQQRALLLAYLEKDCYHTQLDKADKAGRSLNQMGRLQDEKNTITCSACGKCHKASAFTSEECFASPFQRRCIGSMRILHLCAHSSMTWDQFSSEIVDQIPHCHIAPSYDMKRHIRSNALSPKGTRALHSSGLTTQPYCQVHEGDIWAAENPVPAGFVMFQIPRAEPILLYSPWRVEVKLLRDHLKAKALSLYPTSAVKLNLEELTKKLESLEIGLCPHVNFSHHIFHKDFTRFITTNFASTLPEYSRCPTCGAIYAAYITDGGRTLKIIGIRNVGTGDSAMESTWMNATQEPTGGEYN